MSVFEVRGGNDRRSMIKRYERKAKQDAIRELVDLIHCNWSKIEQLEDQLASRLAAVPGGCRLVPIEPTPEMVRAAEEAHMPFGDMETALHMAVLAAPRLPEGGGLEVVMPDITKLVNRFLSWPLPESLRSDPCASIPGYPHRTGTNLMTAEQAKAMLEHLLIDHSAHDLEMVEQPSAAQAKPSIESVLLWLNYYVSGHFNTDDRGPRNALNILCAAFAVDLSSTQAGGRL